MSKLKESLGLIASVLSIGAIALSFYNYFAVDELRRFYRRVKPLSMEVTLSVPVDSTEIGSCVTPISGFVKIPPSRDLPAGTDINMTLAELEIEIWPFVRPLETSLWYPQTRPAITPDGSLSGSINLGDKEGRGIGEEFQVVLLAVRRGTVRPGFPVPDLPSYGCASNTVTVRRVR